MNRADAEAILLDVYGRKDRFNPSSDEISACEQVDKIVIDGIEYRPRYLEKPELSPHRRLFMNDMDESEDEELIKNQQRNVGEQEPMIGFFRTFMPDKLNVIMQGGDWCSSYLLLRPGGLLWWGDGIGDDHKSFYRVLRPSQSEWDQFRCSLDQLRVWEWEPRYRPEGITCDGTVWKVAIGYPDGSQIESRGNNRYPDIFESNRPSKTFEDTGEWREFCASMSTLVKPYQFFK